MARDLFEEAGISPTEDEGGRDLFAEAGITVDKHEKHSAKARDYANAASNALGEGVLAAQQGLGHLLQAPVENARSWLYGANATLGRYMPFLPKTDEAGAALAPQREQLAQDASARATSQRAENLDVDSGSWLNPRTAIARVGLGLQADARQRINEIQADNAATNPELTRQQRAVADANGFTDTLRAMKDNTLATSYTLARSAPEMALGAGAGRAAALAGPVESAVARASIAGTAAEATSSAYNARENTYQQIMAMPVEKLTAAPRFAELVKQLGDPEKAREVLANELADQTPLLTAAGTAAGTMLTNRLFGGDATAKTIAGAEKMSVKELGKRTAQDAAEEVMQGLPEDAVAHAAMVQADPTHKLDIGGSIAQNAVAGTAMGAGGHGAGFVMERAGGRGHGSTTESQAPPEGTPPAATGTDGEPGAAGPSAPAAAPAAGLVEPSAAESALLKPRSTDALARVAEVDTQIHGLEERMAELNREDAGYGPMFDAERLDMAGQLAALDAQRQDLVKDWPAAVDGGKTQFSTEAGVKLDGHYALMDASDLVTSHDTGLRQNPAYPQELQPRERDRAASEMQVSGITQKLDPARLGVSADAATGAPIVGADGLVESGNARSIALKRIYAVPGQRAAEYQQFLRDNAAQFGISPEAVDGMKRPVLVRVRDTPVDRAEFARQANAPTVAAMSPSEQARSDSKRIDSLEDLQPDDNGDFSGPASRPFVRRFMARLPATEQSAMVDAGGALNSAGYARIRNAVLARAYGDSPVLTRMVESMDDNQRNVSRALTLAAPRVAQTRDAVASGARHDADLTPHLMEAVEELSRLKDNGTSVDDALAQAGLLGEQYDPEVRQLLQFLADNARRPRRMADFIVAYQQALDDAGHPGQGALFEDAPPPTKTELMGAAQRSIDGTPDPAENAQRTDAAEDPQAGRPPAERPAHAERDPGGDEGAGAAGSGAGKEVADSWKAFGPESGTLGIPRAEMPQIKAEHRGALTNFLNARGIEHVQEEVPADQLKATQAEYSPTKVEKSRGKDSGDRSILVSRDGHVLDGHHQWLAAKEAGEPVKLLRFDAPIRDLLEMARQFPSADVDPNAASKPDADAPIDLIQRHVEDLAKIVTDTWANSPEVVVVANMQDPNVPASVREADASQKAMGASGEPAGFFHKGKVYLVAGELHNDTEIINVLLHEGLGHYGLRGVFGDDFKPLMRDLAFSRPDLMAAKAREYGFDLKDKNDQWRVADEVLAELAQSKPELGFVKRAVALVRTWLREHVPGFKDLKLTDAEIISNYIVPARGWVERAQRNKGGDVEPAFMRTAAPEAVGKTAAERADDIIKDKVNSARPLDRVARTITRMTGIEWAAKKAYTKAGALLDRAVPERVKAGFVSDYGVPEAVIDQRALLQGRQRVQLRQAGNLIDKLSMLTRAESRVAYAWLNESDQHVGDQLAEQLPAGSREVLEDVRKMIDRLSRDAIRLGQLSPEAYERNKFAYLRRSYAKHVIEQATKGEKARRSRVISILGEQYKGRGLTESAPMAQIKNGAPDWWRRKLQAGKADTALKGEKFVRLERHAPSGEGTGVLDGMEGRSRGRLEEVHYYPADEALPAKYSDWDHAGTWEVRDVKGGDAVMWRDFTKAERENMGEVDEARFAIAKTLHGMVHDVEVGRYLEWLAQHQALKPGAEVPGQMVDASERYRDTFKPDEFVQVPDTKIPGTQVAKYGKLAGRTLPGPVWNDLRQTVNGKFQPFGETYAKILQFWKTAKTALSPAVHTNNIMSNFVMADWRDVSAPHIAKALRLMLGAHEQKDEGVIGRAGNLASRAGVADREAARELLTRYKDSGGDIGGWATSEIARGQIEPLLDAMEKELKATDGESQAAQVGVMAALQHALHLRLPSAWDAFKESKPGKAIGKEASSLIDVYQSEDDVFRLASWLKAKEEGASDLEAGKAARKSFLDYNVNAPWVQAMRSTAFPFIAFSYRAVPMLAEIAGKKPHKLLKLMALAGALNALGYAMSGGDEDKERRLLPEEKAGRIWGMVPKMIRMPWNDAHDSPVFLDIRRFIPVGDVFDVGQGQSAVPILPGLQPGGPLVVAAELLANKSFFTGKPITQEIDTRAEQAGKVIDHLYKAFAPNLLGLPGTYATDDVVSAMSGRTDAFGREASPAQAVASSLGVKLGSYPADVLKRNLIGKAHAAIADIDKAISNLKRQRQTNRITQADFQEQVQTQLTKKRAVQQALQEKIAR